MSINKNIYRSLLIVSFLIINGLILFGISSAVAYMNTGAERSEILNIPIPKETSKAINIKWSVNNCEGRPMEKQTVFDIEKDYLQAWQLKHNAFKTNTDLGLKAYYTDSAKHKLSNSIDENISKKVVIESASLNHNIDVKFYSADGQIVIFEDKGVNLLSHYNIDNEHIATSQQIANYKVMMLLEDGYWRIRHFELKDIIDVNPLPIIDNTNEFASQISAIKGVNYYPQSTPWRMFGDGFDAEVINKDFALLQQMGLNTIRIFVKYQEFGKEYIKKDKLDKLKATMQMAHQNQLKVIPTLFDFYGNYDVTDIPHCLKHAEQIVYSIKDEPALYAWDIKNEPNLDFESRGKENVILWLKEMIGHLQNWDNKHPITIGWSNAEDAALLADQLHFVSFHDYLDPNSFTQRASKLKTMVNNKPILLQEYGYSSYSGIWNMYSSSEKRQANYYKSIQAQLKELNLGFVFWTLYDFNTIPDAVVGYKPWHKSKQSGFGIINKKGNKKVSFQLFNSQKP